MAQTSGRSAQWILLTSAKITAIGVAPLLLYALIGPSDGNPIGLGLLAMLAVLVGVLGVALGIVKFVIDFIQSR
jgi:hypothetical protein